MGKLTSKANHGFLLGSFIFIILLFITVFIFLMWSFKAFQKEEEHQTYAGTYQLELDASTLGCPMMLYINDSLIFSGTPAAAMTLTVGRFAEESMLLAVDAETDQVSLIDLPLEGGKITLQRNGTEFTAGE